MTRYFFDVVGNVQSQYDFRGRAFSEPQKAYQLAQLLALDLEMDGDQEFVGKHVAVRTETGHSLYSVCVRAPELVDA
jgi:hypothetical protein